MCLYALIQDYELLRNRLAMYEWLNCEMNVNCAMNYIGLCIVIRDGLLIVMWVILDSCCTALLIIKLTICVMFCCR